jgi:CRISPR/Cas system-associated exonuclease Cas4 (RecB family)
MKGSKIFNPPTRFLVPVIEGLPKIPGWVDPLEVIVYANGTAEILVNNKAVDYLSKRNYAIKLAPPQGHLSWSQCNMYMRCPRSYFFRYVEGMKVPPSSALAVGSSVHKTAEHNNKQKIFSREDVSLKVAKEVFSQVWDEMAPSVDFKEDENPGQLKDQGVALVDLLMTRVAPRIQPRAAEEEFILEFSNAEYSFKGIIDVVTEQGEIVDFKTASRTPSQGDIDQDRQITTYYLGHEALYGQPPAGAFMDYLVKNKTPKHERFETSRTEADTKKLLALIAEISRSIRNGFFFPNPTNNLCNPRWCGYWNICKQGEGDK